MPPALQQCPTFLIFDPGSENDRSYQIDTRLRRLTRHPFLAQVRNQRPQQRRNLGSDHVPNNVRIHAKIDMRKPIPHPSNLLPFHAWHSRSYVIRKVLGRFTNDLKIPQDRIPGDFILKKLSGVPSRTESDDFLARRNNVPDPILRLTRQESPPSQSQSASPDSGSLELRDQPAGQTIPRGLASDP